MDMQIIEFLTADSVASATSSISTTSEIAAILSEMTRRRTIALNRVHALRLYALVFRLVGPQLPTSDANKTLWILLLQSLVLSPVVTSLAPSIANTGSKADNVYPGSCLGQALFDADNPFRSGHDDIAAAGQVLCETICQEYFELVQTLIEQAVTPLPIRLQDSSNSFSTVVTSYSLAQHDLVTIYSHFKFDFI